VRLQVKRNELPIASEAHSYLLGVVIVCADAISCWTKTELLLHLAFARKSYRPELGR
jgi:hypothetical protein